MLWVNFVYCCSRIRSLFKIYLTFISEDEGSFILGHIGAAETLPPCGWLSTVRLPTIWVSFPGFTSNSKTSVFIAERSSCRHQPPPCRRSPPGAPLPPLAVTGGIVVVMAATDRISQSELMQNSFSFSRSMKENLEEAAVDDYRPQRG